MSRRLQILFICHHTRTRAVHRQMNLARRLVERGHKVSLMVIADKNRWRFQDSEQDGVYILETPDVTSGRLRSGWDPISVVRRSLRLLKDENHYDVVHLFETRPATILPGLILKKRKRLPLFIDWIDWWGRGGLITVNRPKWYQLLFGGIETFFEEYFRKYGDNTTVIAKALQERAIGLGVPASTITHIRSGVDTEHFKPLPLVDTRNLLGLGKAELIIGFASQDSFLDLDIVLEAVKAVTTERPTVRLLMTGHIKSDTWEKIDGMGLRDIVLAPGFVSEEDYPKYLAACDMFLMPLPETNYNVGRWPNKFGEYIATGRPVVFNSTGELADFAELASPPGIVCNYAPEEFAQAIYKLISEADTRRRLGENARQCAVDYLDWNETINKLEAVYQRI